MPSQLKKIKTEKSKSKGSGVIYEPETSSITGIEVNQPKTSTIIVPKVTKSKFDQP